MPGKRIGTLQSVARAIADQAIPDIEQMGNNDAIKAALLNIPGIGPWTVEYFALRALRDTDAWPESDPVLKRATNQLCDSTSLAANRNHAAQWSPYRGYVAMHLWHRAAQMASEGIQRK
jgi:DNA-3-methyladenine glycosylase II